MIIFVSGNCDNCNRYYELPRQDDQASVFMTVLNGKLTAIIKCTNQMLCEERKNGQ